MKKNKAQPQFYFMGGRVDLLLAMSRAWGECQLSTGGLIVLSIFLEGVVECQYSKDNNPCCFKETKSGPSKFIDAYHRHFEEHKEEEERADDTCSPCGESDNRPHFLLSSPQEMLPLKLFGRAANGGVFFRNIAIRRKAAAHAMIANKPRMI